jgi:antibiotic biosynthesis monooxygenase (ABM) superfamily enzyme
MEGLMVWLSPTLFADREMPEWAMPTLVGVVLLVLIVIRIAVGVDPAEIEALTIAG